MSFEWWVATGLITPSNQGASQTCGWFPKIQTLPPLRGYHFSIIALAVGFFTCYNVRVKTIQLTQGQVAIVDDDDFESLSKHKWYFLKDHKGKSVGYAMRNIRVNEKRTLRAMHQDILDLKSGEEGDHRDGNGLHNWKSNLRKSTREENQRNRRIFKNSKTGVRGVTKHGNRYYARMYRNGKGVIIGSSLSLDEARAIRLEAERKVFPVTCL